MTTRSRTFLVLLLAMAAGLAGCAGRGPPPSPIAPSSTAQGTYKVGSPYEINGVWYYPKEDYNYDETGIASWYGKDFHGRYTANGEVFNLNALTAAHRTLPMPSIVQVTNLENGRSIRLRVNDRGPFARSRIIDVSRRAAQLLGFEAQGTARVRVKILVPESMQAAALARHHGEMVADGQAAPLAPVKAEALPTPPGVRVASNEPPPLPPARRPAPPMLPDPPPLTDKVTVEPVKPTQIYIQAGAFAQADNARKVQGRLASLGPVKVMGTRVNGIDLYRVRLGPLGSVDEADRMLDRVVATGFTGARIVVD